jgi:ribosomal protein S4E
MLNSEQTVMNILSMDDTDDQLWTWLTEQVTRVASGKSYEPELVMHEEPYRSSMQVNFTDGRVYVKMENFGFSVSYSWKLSTNPKGIKYLSDFKIENGEGVI